MAARCFLHFRNGRDDNSLSWEAQDEAAARKIELLNRPNHGSGLMRIYFGHARAVQRSIRRNSWRRFLKPGLQHRPVSELAFTASTPDFRSWMGFIFPQQASALEDRKFCYVCFYFAGAAWAEAEHDHRVSDCNQLCLALAHPPRGRRTLAYFAGNFAAATRRRSATGIALAAPAHGIAAPELRLTFDGGARLLSSFHGGRAFVCRN